MFHARMKHHHSAQQFIPLARSNLRATIGAQASQSFGLSYSHGKLPRRRDGDSLTVFVSGISLLSGFVPAARRSFLFSES
jgi:hypothetical protein